jgi:6-phosphogluconolactonase
MRRLTFLLLMTLGCGAGTTNNGNTGNGGSGGQAGSGGRGGSAPGATGGSAPTGGASGTGGSSGSGGSATGGASGTGGSAGTGGTRPPDGPVRRPDAGQSQSEAGRPDGPTASSGKTFVIAAGTYGGSALTVFELNRQTGALTRVGTAMTGSGPTYVAIHPTGRFVYANNEMGSRVQGWSINPDTGALTALNGQPSGGNGPAHISVHKSGRWLLSSNYGSGTAAALAIDDQGRLAPPMATGRAGGDAHMILDDGASGNFVFMPCAASGYVALFKFDATTGMLSPNTPATVATRGRPRHMAFHPSRKFAYVSHENGDPITAFKYDSATGVISDPSNVPGPADGVHVLVHPNGNFMYQLGRGGNALQINRIAEDGAVAAVNRVAGLSTPWDFTTTKDFTYLFVANSVGNTVRSFSVDATTGLVSSRGMGATQESPHAVVVAEF